MPQAKFPVTQSDLELWLANVNGETMKEAALVGAKKFIRMVKAKKKEDFTEDAIVSLAQRGAKAFALRTAKLKGTKIPKKWLADASMLIMRKALIGQISKDDLAMVNEGYMKRFAEDITVESDATWQEIRLELKTL